MLGRAFLNSPDFFEVGTGVHSHTTGIWMSSKPVLVRVKGGGPRVSVIVVDTEVGRCRLTLSNPSSYRLELNA
jgi:hypothetical protein